jgi:2-polyprenyl-3-methyl-5-hydroxy-6-metoxy-1,4-benzoquinol methylase
MTGTSPPPERNLWNARYAGEDYLFGTDPTAFLLREADRLHPRQTALCLADGEGRNSVFLAGRGLAVTALDASEVALTKAQRLAQTRGVTVTYRLGDAASWEWDAQAFDVVVAIFVQFAGPDLRDRMLAGMVRALVPGGRLLLHGYTPAQLALNTGGPRAIENLYTTALLRDRLSALTELHLAEYVADLAEGTRHVGRSALIEYVGQKPG